MSIAEICRRGGGKRKQSGRAWGGELKRVGIRAGGREGGTVHERLTGTELRGSWQTDRTGGSLFFATEKLKKSEQGQKGGNPGDDWATGLKVKE